MYANYGNAVTLARPQHFQPMKFLYLSSLANELKGFALGSALIKFIHVRVYLFSFYQGNGLKLASFLSFCPLIDDKTKR